MAAVVTAAPAPASASVIVFTSRAAWEAQAPGFQTETFNAVPVAEPLAPNTTHTLGLVQFFYPGADTGGTPAVSDDAFLSVNGTRHFIGNVWVVAQGGGTTAPGPNTFTFPSPVTAFGADFVGTTTGAILTVTAGADTVEFDNFLAPPGRRLPRPDLGHALH
jgi:hypothetical protein